MGSEHVHPCDLPRRWWWKRGTRWRCSCRREYWLVEQWEGWREPTFAWTPREDGYPY